MRERALAAVFLALLNVRAAAAQLHVPQTDARGVPLVPQSTLDETIAHQTTVIYILLVFLTLSIGATVWLSIVCLRMQYTFERVAEAIRRVDMLQDAFNSAATALDRKIEAEVSRPPTLDWRHTDDVIVLDEEPMR